MSRLRGLHLHRAAGCHAADPCSSIPQDCCTLAVVLWGEAPAGAAERAHGQLVAVTFEQLMERGRQARAAGWQCAAPRRGDLASLAFTSGTSGKPKVGMGGGLCLGRWGGGAGTRNWSQCSA